MGALQTRDPVTQPSVTPSAVVWINRRRAMVATMSRDGHVTTCEISRGWLPDRAYVAQVVRVIGDRQRVVILGPRSVRLALVREYALTYQRPDRLVDVEPAGAVVLQDLVDRLRTIVSKASAPRRSGREERPASCAAGGSAYAVENSSGQAEIGRPE